MACANDWIVIISHAIYVLELLFLSSNINQEFI